MNPTQKFDAIFLSPHLDDAVLSCGHTIHSLTKKNKKSLVVTVFAASQTDFENFSSDSQAFLKKSGNQSFSQLFTQRKKEDNQALKILGAQSLHLANIDAGFRFSKSKESIYPSNRHVFGGKIHPKEQVFIRKLYQTFDSILTQHAHSKTQIFLPLAIGNHVDHHIIFNYFTHLSHQYVFWEDVPYRNHPQQLFSRLTHLPSRIQLQKKYVFSNQKIKYQAILAYQSQFTGLIKNGLSTYDFHFDVLYYSTVTT